MSAEDDSGLIFDAVQMGRRRTDFGKSHSCERPTSQLSSPSAQRTSVQAGSSETMRGLGMLDARVVHSAGHWRVQPTGEWNQISLSLLLLLLLLLLLFLRRRSAR